jgi:predicted RNase H-like nuclease
MTYVGVDWASGLWVTVALGDDISITTHPSILNVWHEYKQSAEAMLVDIPIGLPESGTRACDHAAETMLKERSSTVFAVPARDIVEIDDYCDARETNDDSLGSQSWWLFPRIREVDVFLQEVNGAIDRIYESHPEVCFAALAGEPLQSKNSDAGVDDRVVLLEALDEDLHVDVRKFVHERRDNTAWHHRISEGRINDVVDAAVLAGTAAKLGLGERDSPADYPALPETGDRPAEDPMLDIPMEIVFPGRDVS